jgi:hypothetical protein
MPVWYQIDRKVKNIQFEIKMHEDEALQLRQGQLVIGFDEQF